MREYIGRAIPATDADFQAVADDIAGGDANKVRAVWAVEAPRGPFYRLPDGLAPSALYEGHIAWRESAGPARAALSRLGLAWARWGQVKYGSYAQQYERIDRANAASPGVGYVAASWGGPQILGTNASAVGFRNARDMALAFADSELNQLRAFAAFLKRNGLDRHMRSGAWAAFARGYNGPSYATHNYDGRIKAAYDRLRLSGAAAPTDPLVQEAQELLNDLGFGPVKADGWLGPRTKAAVLDFQRGHPDLHNDGVPGPHTLAALRKAAEARRDKQKAGTGMAGTAAGGGLVATGAAFGWNVAIGIAIAAAALAVAYVIWRRHRSRYATEIEAAENYANGAVIEREPLADRIGEHVSVLNERIDP